MNLTEPKPIRENPREMRFLREVAEEALMGFDRNAIADFVIAAQRTIVSDEYDYQDSQLDEDEIRLYWHIRLLDVGVGGNVIHPSHCLDLDWAPEIFMQVSDVLSVTDRGAITADQIVEAIIEDWNSRDDRIEVRSGAVYLKRNWVD
ncbi:hypothetical protein [Citreimonas salinaria]|uniref:Uncharacterized protein n=1 Tax=Citreimonas salinaria TaxID=321339 RepID=A0A1H3NHP6_9RHOB|nr:hypothetical protein [Citreimonas salinaria]SDY88273.1 hypothetical protein SAMN05444340_12423 [Citreimonas salinaria]